LRAYIFVEELRNIPLHKDDIESIHLRGRIEKHYAYVCKKCDYIIGFGAVAH